MSSVRDTALAYVRAGLCVLPAHAAEKRPAVPSWKEYQRRRPTETEIGNWFRTDRPLCILAGATSGNLEMLDFDCAGERFAWWRELVEARSPGLTSELVLERSPSGGWHVVYRCQSSVCGNMKLAERAVVVPGGEEVEFYGKRYKPRRVGDRWEVGLTLIETRGEGGVFLCHPSPGYELVQGRFEQLPVLSDEQRELLLEVAWSLNEVTKTPEPEPVPASGDACDGRPGDDFNQRGDVRELLHRHGWTLVRPGENEHWCRPGKSSGASATLKDRIFCVFSSNAAPFEPDRAYGPFSVYALLEHGGDYSAAASALRVEGFGDVNAASAPSTSPISVAECVPEMRDEVAADPGPLPDAMLHVPGFVADVMAFTLGTAPYPNRAMAFAGALALQATLSGRKVREPGNLRTNLQILALANTGVGKDWPRKVNARVLLECGEARKLAGKSASGEGVEDRLVRHPVVLKQDDEIDTLFENIQDNKDARYRNQLAALLELYGEAGGWRAVRDKAGRDSHIVHQPHLVLFGTTTPTAFYGSLSSKMINKGMLARLTPVEAGCRQRHRRASWPPLPAKIMEVAKFWSDFRPPNWGNLSEDSTSAPHPLVVPIDDVALAAMDAFADECDDAYAVGERAGNEPVMAVWARGVERATQLALVYACSERPATPTINVAAVDWATAFVRHGLLRALYMLGQHFHESDFEANCNALLVKLREWAKQHGANAWMPHRYLRKRLKRLDTKQFDEAWKANVDLEQIEIGSATTGGRPGRVYRIASLEA